MRAQRTAQPRRACDTTVFSCANGEVSVRSVTLSQSGSHRGRSGSAFAVSLSRCGGQLTSFQRSSLRRVSGRSWASSIAHRRCRRKGLGSARVPTFISRAGPESPVPGPTRSPVCTTTGATTRVPWTLAGRVPSGARWSSSLCASGSARSGACVHVAVATSTRLAVRL